MPQIVVLLAALFLIVLLIIAPRLPKDVRQVSDQTSAQVADPVNQKINQAVALVQGGENPMQGIMMLREILEEDPDQIDAHWHLAQFSIQSGQYEKAVERFEKVLEIDRTNQYPDASFYLGKTYATLNRNEEAIAQFNKYLEQVQDTTVRKRVNEFIEELKD